MSLHLNINPCAYIELSLRFSTSFAALAGKLVRTRSKITAYSQVNYSALSAKLRYARRFVVVFTLCAETEDTALSNHKFPRIASFSCEKVFAYRRKVVTLWQTLTVIKN